MVLVRVESSEKGYHAVAARAIEAGAVVCRIEGDMTTVPTRFSLQVGVGCHVAPRLTGSDDGPAWRFTNHSCDPNSALRGQALVALRSIVEGDEITFDYETTEYDMAEPFVCHCGADQCRGTIRGFRHTTPTVRERLRPLLAPHLLDREPGGGDAAS